MLPYSINEIYGFRLSKYSSVKQVYNEAFQLYQGYKAKSEIKPTLIITEDSKTGYQFFSSLGIKCISANGKSNIIKKLANKQNENVVIIADGAALGPEMDSIMGEIKEHSNITLYAPESFEWLLLKAGLFENGNKIKEILENPSDYIESKKFFSWERFFTYYIVGLTTKLENNNTMIGYKYLSSKDKLPDVYTSPRVRDKILAVIPKIKFT